MDWGSIIVAVIAAAGGFLGSLLSNNRQLAIVSTKLDMLKEELDKQANRLDQRAVLYDKLNERITALETKMSYLSNSH